MFYQPNAKNDIQLHQWGKLTGCDVGVVSLCVKVDNAEDFPAEPPLTPTYMVTCKYYTSRQSKNNLGNIGMV